MRTPKALNSGMTPKHETMPMGFRHVSTEEWQWNNDGFTLKLTRDQEIDAPIQQSLSSS